MYAYADTGHADCAPAVPLQQTCGGPRWPNPWSSWPRTCSQTCWTVPSHRGWHPSSLRSMSAQPLLTHSYCIGSWPLLGAAPQAAAHAGTALCLPNMPSDPGCSPKTCIQNAFLHFLLCIHLACLSPVYGKPPSIPGPLHLQPARLCAWCEAGSSWASSTLTIGPGYLVAPAPGS